MRAKTETDLMKSIAQAISVAVDGHVNDWQDFKPEAESVYKILRSQMRDLLLTSSDVNLRRELNGLFGLNVYSAIFQNDFERKIRPQSRRIIPDGRRRTRRRSSASASLY